MLSSLAILALAQSPAPAPALPPRKDLCEVRVRSERDLARLSALVSDVDDHAPLADGWARIYSTPAEEARLVREGWELRVVQTDLANYYEQRALQAPNPAVMGGSMGGFKTLAEIEGE